MGVKYNIPTPREKKESSIATGTRYSMVHLKSSVMTRESRFVLSRKGMCSEDAPK